LFLKSDESFYFAYFLICTESFKFCPVFSSKNCVAYLILFVFISDYLALFQLKQRFVLHFIRNTSAIPAATAKAGRRKKTL